MIFAIVFNFLIFVIFILLQIGGGHPPNPAPPPPTEITSRCNKYLRPRKNPQIELHLKLKLGARKETWYMFTVIMHE